jgi:hypothetical protein
VGNDDPRFRSHSSLLESREIGPWLALRRIGVTYP